MMKRISFCIPSYNSEAYMEKCIDSILSGGEEIEILIVDDGSKDGTGAIADRYEQDHPGIVRAIHQQNAGHGGAVNTGIQNASGMYFKVVDSDDWVDENSLKTLLTTLRGLEDENNLPDMVLINYVLENAVLHTQNVIRPVMFQPNRILGWKDMKQPRIGQYLMMHSVIYRTHILRDHAFSLPEHCFHVDNLFVYEPLTHVEKIYYLDVDFYRYFIGREGQSVSEEMMVKRIDQHILVNRLMIDAVRPEQIREPKLREYLFLDLEILTAITSVFLLIPNDHEHMEKKKKLWDYLQEKDPIVYARMRRRFLGWLLTRESESAHQFAIWLMRMVRKTRGN